VAFIRLLPTGRFALGVVAFALLLTVAVLGVTALRSAGAGAGEGGVLAAHALPVEAFTVRYEDATPISTFYPGLIAPRRQSALGFEAGGRVARVVVNVGDRVTEGQILASLDTRALEARYQAARAEAAAAQADAQLAQVTLERQRRLVEQGHASAQRLDETAANARAASARAAAAEANTEALGVQLELASLEAPFDGVITERLLDEGAIAQPGAPVLRLVEDGALELRVSLPAAEARRLESGASMTAVVDGLAVPVTLRSTTGVIELDRRAVNAVFDLEPQPGLSSGSVARLRLETVLAERGFSAPVTALAEGRRGLWAVYLLVPEDGYYRLEARPVEMLHTEDNQVFLRGAVNDGDFVLAAGLPRVIPGQRVRLARGD